MLKQISLITVVGLLSLATLGCTKDFLEQTPTDAIAAADALSSADNIRLILNGLHRYMFAQAGAIPGGSGRRTGEQFFIAMDDAISGDLIHSSRGNSWLRPELQWIAHTIPTNLTVEQLWLQRYHFIASANSIINKVTEGDAPLDENLNEMLGQAYSYRAWAYYRLITHYAKGYIIGTPSSDPGVPIIFATEAPFESAPRATVEEVYTQMEKDIDEAIKHFKEAKPRPTGNPKDKSQININVAYGIKARIALSKGNWQVAAEAAVEARKGFPLLDKEEWLLGFNSNNLSEVIWGGNVIITETTYYRSYFYLISPTFNGSQNRGNPKLFNKERYHQIPDTDYRKLVVLPMAPNTNSAASNGQGGSYTSDPNYDTREAFDAAKKAILNKYGMTSRHNTHPYMHVKFLQKNPGTIEPDDVIYMRASEMYLIEAEAKAMMNDITGAQAALEPLGSSRDSAYDVTVFNTKEKFMEHIKFQRYVELYGEGFGYTDHIRWDMGIDHTNSGASEVLYQDGFSQEKPSINNAWIFKIPQDEIDANPNINESNQN